MVVKHVDMETNKLLDEEVISGLEGDKVEVESKSFDGYVLNIAEDKDKINSANDLIKDALENYESEKIIDNSKLEEEKSFYNSKDDKYNLDSNLKNTDIVDEIISDDYEENSEITEDETDNKLEEKNIKQHYDIVLDPNEKEYIIYYKKK